MSHRASTSIEIRLFKALQTNSWRAVSLIDLIFPASSRIISERDRPCYRYSGNPIRISPHIPHCHELKCVIQFPPPHFQTATKTWKNPILLFFPMPVLHQVFKNNKIKVFNGADPKKQISVRRPVRGKTSAQERLLQIMTFAAVTSNQSQEQGVSPRMAQTGAGEGRSSASISCCSDGLCSFTTVCIPHWLREGIVENRLKPLWKTANRYPLSFLWHDILLTENSICQESNKYEPDRTRVLQKAKEEKRKQCMKMYFTT